MGSCVSEGGEKLIDRPGPTAVNVASATGTPSTVVPTTSTDPGSSPMPTMRSITSATAPRSSTPVGASKMRVGRVSHIHQVVTSRVIVSGGMSPRIAGILRISMAGLIH